MTTFQHLKIVILLEAYIRLLIISKINNTDFLSSQFWIGNVKIHALLSQGAYELRIDLEDFNGNTAYAKYSTFSIGDENSNFKLNANGYSGTAGQYSIY